MSAAAALLAALPAGGEPDSLHVEAYFDAVTGTASYLVLELPSRQCALIDTVLDYCASSARISYANADKLIARVRALNAQLTWILETHVHADHLSAAAYIQGVLGGKTGIGNCITQVQATFADLFNLGRGFRADGSQFDHLFNDGDAVSLGSLSIRAMHTPGHTPACITYVIGGDVPRAAFVGDTLFMPDYGTARCDFPGGDARQLYQSIQKVLALPPETVLYTGHDYQPGGREPRFDTTVAAQRADNLHVGGLAFEDDFIAMRAARDATLKVPALMIPAVQVNIRGGKIPESEHNGVAYLRIPLNAL